MVITEELDQVSTVGDSIVTIGVFDGVHLGHRHLLQKLIENARKSGNSAGVVTFKNHPATIVNPDFRPNFLTSIDDRIQLLQSSGVDFIAPVTFNKYVAGLTAVDFIKLLQEGIGMKGLVVGPDFCMGKNREANVSSLRTLGREMGFSLQVVSVQESNGISVRSTTLRELISQGDVNMVSLMLGRPFSFSGNIVAGFKRGREIGFPTANIETKDGMVIPKNGIYSTIAHLGNRKFMSATSIGTRPTFDDGERVVETFILDFDEDIYGQSLRLEFIEHIRNEIAYATVKELVDQIRQDVDVARVSLKPLIDRMGQ
ncbi:MAG: bifunctional riboflavin kinase/FAD synthetase [Chloroflexota bacterium]|nr:bifunctional riboflavin kinase/FAD synthetase [Chloroflexota bacterium]MEC9278420.1 bifunctional riboflavin kinase/FAD synthetase [Chloroflexota bacterium]